MSLSHTRNGALAHAAAWMNLENILPSFFHKIRHKKSTVCDSMYVKLPEQATP